MTHKSPFLPLWLGFTMLGACDVEDVEDTALLELEELDEPTTAPLTIDDDAALDVAPFDFDALPEPRVLRHEGEVHAASGRLRHAPEGYAALGEVERRGALEAMARDTLAERRDWWPADMQSPPDLRFDAPLEIEGGLVVLHAAQLWDGLPVDAPELTFAFHRGNLVGFAGRLLAARPVAPGSERSAQAVREHLRADVAAYVERVVDDLPVDPERPMAPGSELEQDALERLELRRVVVAETGRVVWKATLADRHWTIDEATLAITDDGEADHHAVFSRNVPVRHRTVSRTNWKSSLDTTSNPASSNGSMSVDVDDSLGLCWYRLKREVSYSNGLAPYVHDWDGGEMGPLLACDTPMSGLPCGLSFDCPPTAGDGSFYRQQHYYYFLRRARSRAGMAFNHYAPLSDWDVGMEIDRPLGSCGSDAAACFSYNPWSRWIFLTKNGDTAPSVSTVFHEFGHYFIWAYGGVSENCGNGDEGNAVDETLSTTVSNLMAIQELDLRYQDASFTPYYGTSDFPEVVIGGAAGCNLYTDEHFMGRGFNQAVWQIAFGADCAADDCSGTMEDIRGDIPWASQSSAATHLMRAIAFALKTLPPGLTHEQVAVFMHVYLMTNTNIPIANGAAQVFQTHGLM